MLRNRKLYCVIWDNASITVEIGKWADQMESKRVKDLELRILMEATGILQQLYGVIESEKYTGGCVAITSYSRRVQLFQGHNQAQIDSS